MIKRRLTFVLLLALLPFVGWAQKNYDGQHISIKKTIGDSIQYDISWNRLDNFRPVIRNGRIVWSFNGWKDKRIDKEVKKDVLEEIFSLDNVESIDFRSKEFDEVEVRKALIEFYNEMDGDNWPEEYKTNWCSDKPIWEWYGINGDMNQVPWVRSFAMVGVNNLKTTHIPECIQRMGPIFYFEFARSNVDGNIPDFFGKNYYLSDLHLGHNKLSGSIPNNLTELPNLHSIGLCDNQFNGLLPEDFVAKMIGKDITIGIDLKFNSFSGKVPEKIKNHPRFNEYWPNLIIQNGGGMDFSDLTIPAPLFSFKDVNGNTYELAEVYKKNKFTLLYTWGWWCPWSELYNQQLIPAYLGYKDKGFEVIGFHRGSDEENAKLKDFTITHSIPWINSSYYDWNWINGEPKDETEALTWTTSTPQVLLVDQNGNVVFNSYMDTEGNNQTGSLYRNELFPYLEKQFGPIDYNFYTSTDYSHDGEVVTLQEASIENGIDLVFVGEGFTDRNLEENIFDQKMYQALHQFFLYEPYASLRDRFNVYAVKTVSPNEEFYGANAKHAIDEDISKALEYASKVPNLKSDRPMRVAVIYNNYSGGRSYCTMMEDDSFVCFAMDGVSTVLNHEAGGHGIGKLLDEYVEKGNESLTLPDKEKTDLENLWTAKSWGANVDWRSTPTEVKWAKFISDERYLEEKIGIYEGSYLYGKGAYRPTENSMMRYNDTPFNAPSREEIYKRVMKETEGDGWTYDYDTFATFDVSGHQQFVDALTNASRRAPKAGEQQQIQTAPPVFVKGTWRDALKNKK
jgi:hypothetical protein